MLKTRRRLLYDGAILSRCYRRHARSGRRCAAEGRLQLALSRPLLSEGKGRTFESYRVRQSNQRFRGKKGENQEPKVITELLMYIAPAGTPFCGPVL